MVTIGSSNEEGLGFDNLYDFAALILATMRAGAMGANFFMAVGALRELGDGQSVVGAAGGSAALGVAAFWIRHSSLSFSILIL